MAETTTFREALERIHAAGGKAWDDVPDPDGLIRYWRGDDDPAAVAAGEAFDKANPPEPLCQCGGLMLPWQRGLVYRDCDDPQKITLRCAKCGAERECS